MPLPAGSFLVDAHQDLAMHCQMHGRDLVDPGDVSCMITLGWLQQAGTRLICATLFVEHEHPRDQRLHLLNEQYGIYRDWLKLYPEELRLITSRRELAELATAPDVAGRDGGTVAPIGIVLLMEGLDLLDSPAELALWHARGLRMAGLTWNGRNRYASGTFSDQGGLSQAGRQLLSEFEQLGMILDLAHLNDRGITEVLGNFRAPVCSTHANARALAGSERNLQDWQIREIAARRGVIGHVLLAPFLVQPWNTGDPQPALHYSLDHIEYVAQLAGPDCIGIGSDLDGGLTVENTPQGINDVRDLRLLREGLAARGWDAERLDAFYGGNWWNFLERSLPL
ncbi:MAG: membrane dipeptidase [bacterium]